MTNMLQFDCLNYYNYHVRLAYQELSDVIDESIPYCFRPIEKLTRLIPVSIGPFSAILSFEEIRISDITALELLLWSVPIETIERYQLYLNEPNEALDEQFYNCTPPWFGLYCEYSFEFGEKMSLNEIVENDFLGRTAYTGSSDVVVKVPCYVLLECYRTEQQWCLDWREICDGKVDCFDGSADEEFCFDMEINECEEDEYRCHNGLCISEDLWEDGMGDIDCLDRSDSDINFSFIHSCYQDPSFRCDEHSCRPALNSFSCGDGQCVYQFEACRNGRHELLIDSFTVKGNLTDECWIAMVCLTGFARKCNKSLLTIWSIENKTIFTALEQCDIFFNFPTIPVQSNHIYLLFNNLSLKEDLETSLLPDYVCYNQRLCDAVKPDFIYENQTCINRSSMFEFSDVVRNPWVALTSSIKRYFSSCSFFTNINHSKTNHINNPSLYKCKNSSKLVSIHRIMDGLPDCFEEDDETYENSCQLNDRFRVACINETKCWSPLVIDVVCFLNGYDSTVYIPFDAFCDGIEDYFYDNDGKDHSDEFGCGNWSCNNMYTRCNGYWTCPDGRDEDKCGQQICPSQKYPCISPSNFTVSCLPSHLVHNTVGHCLGNLHEQSICQASHSFKGVSYPFRCSENDECLQLSQLCDNRNDCEESDDDERFCQNQPLTCNYNSMYMYNDAEKVICEMKESSSRQVKYFSVYTSSDYPVIENSVIEEFNYWPTEHYFIDNRISDPNKVNSWPWYCNRGLLVRIWAENNTVGRACMCPPSYYGPLCEYQSQRISISLKLSSNERSATFAIVIMLVDDSNEQQEIDDYDQFIYVVAQTCSIKLNRYLLFRTRPKNMSKNYSIRIDVIEKNALSYRGSWYYPINFLFLPVNRLGISLNLSNHLLTTSFNCLTTCKNGQCIKYFNKNISFCRCFPKWTGLQCNIPVDCQACSSDSMCIGSTNNRPVCVCPIDKFGRRCLLTVKCPVDACQNNGQCLPADVSIPGKKYTCLCPLQFFGQFCQYRKAKLNVFLDGIPAPLYLAAHFFTLSNKSDPIETIVLRKFNLFQRSVTFHIAVPFQLVFVKADSSYYLAILQQIPKSYISTSISPAQKCESTDRLLNQTILNMIPYRRVIHFHLLCQKNYDLTCFVDKAYLCLCTNDHHANCLPFISDRRLQCPLNNICDNHGQCFQDHPNCPSTRICLCPGCFFGDRCQYYAKGMGSTLDEILGYEIKSNTNLSKQSAVIKFTAIMTIIMLILAIINGIIVIFIFSRKASREVGCGIYLLTSSFTSMITMILSTMKFWFLFSSYQHFSGQQYILQGNCFVIEPLLRVFLYYNNWLNAFMAIERSISVIRGVAFDKDRSKRIAKYVTTMSFISIIGLLIPQLLRLDLFYEEMEERTWCVVKYVPWTMIYRTAFIYIHYFGPLVTNILSIVVIITLTAYQKHRIHRTQRYITHIQSQLKIHKNILISTATVILLTLPHLILSFLLDCEKSSRIFWLSLMSYLLSFFPITFGFFIYALPSPLYRKQFKALTIFVRRRLEIWKLNSGRL